jgi:hypothetical protein
MKLYNIFNEIILENIANNTILSENVSSDKIKDCINGKYNVNILYRDFPNQPPSKRYIQVYNLGQTKSGNDAIRAFQLSGGSKKGNTDGFWKIFRVDRIEGWYPTKVTWTEPISNTQNVPPYNYNGDKTMNNVIYKINN